MFWYVVYIEDVMNLDIRGKMIHLIYFVQRPHVYIYILYNNVCARKENGI